MIPSVPSFLREMEAGAGGRGGALANAPPAAALGPEALHGLEFAHRQVGLLLDAMTRAIQRSNTTVSAGSSANTTPQKGDRHEGKVLQLARKFDGTPQDGGYLQYHQSRSPFGRRRDAADEREALLGIRSKLEVLQQRLESFISFPSAPSPAQASSAKPRDHLAEIDEARDELLWLALRKVDVVVRERTVLEAVIGFTRSGTIELEDGMDDLVRPFPFFWFFACVTQNSNLRLSSYASSCPGAPHRHKGRGGKGAREGGRGVAYPRGLVSDLEGEGSGGDPVAGLRGGATGGPRSGRRGGDARRHGIPRAQGGAQEPEEEDRVAGVEAAAEAGQEQGGKPRERSGRL